MLIHRSINFLRRTALLLFIVPFIGLIGSLLVHNYLVSYKYSYEFIIPFKTIESGSTFKILCTKENNMCLNFKKTSKLNQCSKFLIDVDYYLKDGLIKI